MSADVLRDRAVKDFQDEIEKAAAILVEARQATLDELRFQQGLVAGLKLAGDLLTERWKNLYAVG